MTLSVRVTGRSTTLVVDGDRTLTVRGAGAGRLTTVDVGRTGPQGPRGDAGPAGPAGPSGSSYLHTQGAASDTWTIPHNLGFAPSVEVRTTGGLVVEAEVVHVSTTVAQVSLAAPLAGTARCN